MKVEYRYNDATGNFELVEETDISNILSINAMLESSFNSLREGQTYVGIDFGTSTTVVSIASYDKTNKVIVVEPMRLDQLLEDGTKYQSEKLPSVIAWYRNTFLVGEGASNLKYKLQKGKDIWYSFKMEIGEDLGAKYYNSSVKNFNGISIINPKDCVKVFFMYLKMLIERYCTAHNLSHNICYAVSIPASFEANQRKELMEALETNGMTLTKQSLIDEPNAAFISYVHESQQSEKPLVINANYNPKVLVFDFGGGTCDISILEIGKSVSGLYSKNLAISKFTKLGGDDVDRYISFHYLLPRFLEKNNKNASDFITSERQFMATQLYKVAERLKIQISKSLAVKMNDLKMSSDKNSTEKYTINVPIEVSTSKGKLTQFDFYLTYKELTDTMANFLKERNSATTFSGEEEYNNIYMPINSAISKANTDIDELDYVLLIGGSAQSPYIQESLNNHFPNATILVPQNLQTHVSQGAAIHSLLMNGINKCIIQPITSEPIIVLTLGQNKMVMPAGTVIPSDVVTIDDLVTAREGQTVIELPICVGNKDKMLYNLKITKSGGFPKNSKVTLSMEINADKLLQVSASCLGESCMIEPQNPFANKELTSEERMVLAAERKANIESEQNGGRPSQKTLEDLREAYKNAGNDFKAAETYELQYSMYPDSCNTNNIGVLYHNAGNYTKAIEFYNLALEESPRSHVTLSNLGHTYYLQGNIQKAEECLTKAHEIAPYHGITLIKLAQLEARQGKQQDARKHKEEAYEVLKKQWDKRTLSKVEQGWFSSLARELGHEDVYQQVKQNSSDSVNDHLYNIDNLTIIN
jgi:molecular chaperone DnaK (HSP70)